MFPGFQAAVAAWISRMGVWIGRATPGSSSIPASGSVHRQASLLFYLFLSGHVTEVLRPKAHQ